MATCLQRLQSLETDYEDFEKQLEQIRNISQLDRSFNRQGSTIPRDVAIKFHGREEWAIRWLLKKTLSNGANASEARLSGITWTTLAHLIAVTPAHLAAKTLSANKFLDCLDRTLQESFGSQRRNSISREQSTPEDNLRDTLVDKSNNLENNTQNISSSSKKRKRERFDETEAQLESGESSKNSTKPEITLDSQNQKLLSLFQGLALFLENISKLTSRLEAKAWGILHGSQHSFLSTNFDQSTSILGAWLSALSYVVANRFPTEENQDRINASFATIFRIWETRSANLSDQGDGTSISFSKHCLVPAAILLGTNAYTTTDLNGISGTVNGAVEQLLAKHLFMAARSNFFNKLQRKDASADHSLHEDIGDLSHLLQPLRSISEKSIPEKALEDSNVTFSLRSSIPVLFNIAVRCTPLSTPRRRVAEFPWLENVFLQLMSCLDLDKNQNKPTDVFNREKERSHFTRLLEIATRSKLKFGHTTVETIARDRCDLSSSMNAEPNWTAVSHLIELDTNIFLKKTKISGSRRGGSQSDLCSMLFASISDRVYVSIQPGTQHSTFNPPEYESVQNRVLIPLLRAYSSARDTAGFLRHWYQGLIRFSQDDYHMNDWSIWEDPNLHMALVEILESTMTSNQIIDFVKERLTDLQAESGADVSTEEFHKASASAVVLTAIFDAIQSDETANVLFPLVFETLTGALMHLGLVNSANYTRRFRLWRLVSSSHRLWLESTSTEDFMNTSQPNEVISKPLSGACTNVKYDMSASSEAKSSMTSHEEFEALACLGSILDDLQTRKWISDEIKNIAISLLTLSIQNFELKSSHRQENDSRLWEVVAQYPILLRAASVQSKNGLKEKVLHRMMGPNVGIVGQDLNANRSSTTKRMWSDLIARSLEDSTWLLEDIQRALRDMDTMQANKHVSISELTHLHAVKELSYMHIPSASFPARERKKILNNLIETIKTSGSAFQPSDWSRTLSFILHMMNVLNDAVGLSIPFADILIVTDIIDTLLVARNSHEEAAYRHLAIFKKIAEQSLRHDVHIAGQKQAEGFLEKVISEAMQPSTSRRFGTCRLTVISAALDVLSSLNANQAEISSVAINIQANLCQRICDSVSQKWTELEHADANKRLLVQHLESHVEVLAQVHDSALRNHQFAVHSVRTIIERVLEEIKSNSTLPNEAANTLAVLNYKLGWKTDSQDPEALEFSPACAMLQEGLQLDARRLLQEFLLGAFLQLSEQQRVDKIRDLLDDCQNAGDAECTSRWQLLHMLVSASNNPKSTAPRGLIPSSEVPTILMALSSSLPRSRTVKTFHYIASTITILLRNTTKPTTHPAIESALLAISSVLSQKSLVKTSIGPIHGPKIFTSLTTILRILLTQHRPRLRGRFDLLIATLQSLLTHLFILPRTPPRSVWTLTATHATAFTRLVTILCDPSVSSTATSRHPSVHLTDERRKARMYAGQYVPALLLTLCDLQLRGRFAGEGVREILAPGVYVMLDVMGGDVLAATNERAGMSSGVRTVLKQWVETWRRERR